MLSNFYHVDVNFNGENHKFAEHAFLTKRRMSKSCNSPNFTALEKSILLELIDFRKDIIHVENKQNDGKMVSKKNSVWEKITSECNACHCVNQRTCTQL